MQPIACTTETLASLAALEVTVTEAQQARMEVSNELKHGLRLHALHSELIHASRR